MSCPERERYVANANTLSGLENLLGEALGDIRRNLNNVARVRGVQEQLALKSRSDGQILLTLPDQIRVWILEKRKWNQIFGRYRRRGAYSYKGNKILLEQNSWCRKTMIHESLHSVSIFSDPHNRENYKIPPFFKEGTTEFVTGLLLFQRYRNCYENWRFGRFPQWCSVSCPKEVKTFLAFCGCANVQSLLDFYFGTQTSNLLEAWSGFITAIRRDTGTRFKDVFREGERIGLYIAFKNECERRFGKRFRKLQKLLDYGRVFASP